MNYKEKKQKNDLLKRASVRISITITRDTKAKLAEISFREKLRGVSQAGARLILDGVERYDFSGQEALPLLPPDRRQKK